MKIIPRTEITEPTYVEILEREPHDHVIIKDDHGTLRWLQDDDVSLKFDTGELDLNSFLARWREIGIGKNSEEYRLLYRNLGYSLSGYWEVFYWEVNNSKADEYVYKPPLA